MSSKHRLLAKIVIVALAGLALPSSPLNAADIFWNGGTGSYTNAAGWGGTVPGPADHAINNSGSNNVVKINEGDPIWTVIDLIAGNADNTSGAYEQNGSSVKVGNPGGWFRFGVSPGSFGIYTLNSGNLTNTDQIHVGENGNAVLNINGGFIRKTGGQFSISDTGTSGAAGVVNQSAGTVDSSSEIWVANNNGTATYNFSGGTINLHNWFAIGRGNNAVGVFNMTGGAFTKDGGGNFLVGTGGSGTLNQSGGTITCANQFQVPENGSASVGIYNMSGTAAMSVNDWLAIGRNGGNGTLNLTNGSITKTGGGNIAVGAGGGAMGTLNQYGGFITNTANPNSFTYLSESGGNGTWNMYGGTATIGVLQFCQGGNGVGAMYLNGGLLGVSEINCGVDGANGTFYFNGGTLRAAADNANFFHGLGTAYVQAGGAIFDSQAFSVTVAQALNDSGGGLTKNGTGTLTLTGANNYTGPTMVNAGTLVVQTDSSASGNYTVASGAQLRVKVHSANAQLNVANATFNSSTPAAGFDLGNFGNPASAPLNVTGTLAVNGTVSINVIDTLPQVGQFPLIKYAVKTGAGSFVLGSLPVGIVAALSNNVANASIDLVIQSVNLPRWDGQAGGNWDIGLTTNWINIGTGLPTFYGEGNAVLFDDNALGTTTANLVTTVNPSSVTINNSSLNYTLVGSGKISGATGLTKQGSGIATIRNTGGNNYTGPTIISGGTLSVTNVANGGSPSAIGASSASPTNLVLAGGTLAYSGPAVTINRGYRVQGANNSLDVQGNLTLSGLETAASGGGFSKMGPAQLTYTGVGANSLSGLNSSGYRVENGIVRFDGSAGPQTNIIESHLGVGGLGGVSGTLVLTNTTVNVPSGGMDLGRSGGATGTLVINTGAIMTVAGGVQGGNVALGDGGGTPSFGIINQNGGLLDIGGELWLGQLAAGVGNYNLSGGTLNLHNWLAIGRNGGNGTFTITGGTFNKDGGSFIIGGNGGSTAAPGATGLCLHSGGTINCSSEYWIAEGATDGTNIMSASAVLNLSNWVAIGRGGNATFNFLGGTMTKSANGAFIIGAGGTGVMNQSGGTFTNLVNETWVAENGTGTWNMNGGTATLGILHIAQGGSGVGILNLNGGSIGATEVTTANTGASSTLNLNGGVLLARASTANFLHDLTAVNVLAGGALIDTDTNSIGISQPLLTGSSAGLTKSGTGTLRLNGVNTYTGTTLVSAGGLGGTGTIAGPVSVSAGASLTPGASIGTLTINNTLTLAAGSTTFVEVSLEGGVTNADLVTGLTGVSYAGSLVVTNVGATALVSGTVFKLFNSAGPGSGNFSSITVLPAGTGSFNPVTGELTITVAPIVNPPFASGGNLILTSSGGTPGTSYSWITSTNVAAPLVNWITNTTGLFDGSGISSNAVPINTAEPARFFRLKTP
jgi:autotransporter-associated beta strand protein